jgi:uncharacterized membrane protein YciS (DUF1049 family)
MMAPNKAIILNYLLTTGELQRLDAVVNVLFEVAMVKGRLTRNTWVKYALRKWLTGTGKPSTTWLNGAQLNRPQVG